MDTNINKNTNSFLSGINTENVLQAIIIILIIIFLYYCLYRYSGFNTIDVKSKIDGESYKVHNIHPEYEKAADMLAQINKKNITFFRYLRDNYTGPNAKHLRKDLQDNLNFLLQNYNPENIQETSPRNIEGQTSYVTDKGDTISYCVRGKKDLKFHDLDHLMFVNLHEITHIFSYKETGHPTQFWRNFKWILQEAEKAGIHTPVDYSQKPFNYCGMDVNYSPYYDRAL